MSLEAPQPSPPANLDAPRVLFVGDCARSEGHEKAQLELACRFHGFPLAPVAIPQDADAAAPLFSPRPLLLVVHAAALAGTPASVWRGLAVQAAHHEVPVALVGITPDCDSALLEAFAGFPIPKLQPRAQAKLWVPADDPQSPGFVLRQLGFGLPPVPAFGFTGELVANSRILAAVGPGENDALPSLLHLGSAPGSVFLLAGRESPAASAVPPWEYQRALFGEIIPWFLLLRTVGGLRCWHAPAALANLTIDDPWLIEPYGCLSYPGLLAEMKREGFHTTLGFVPWNYDRSRSNVVALLRENSAFFSIAVHGNNHDHYEFFRYESRPGDRQKPKPFAAQAEAIRQAAARMDEFHRLTDLDFDRVMVFPHGICPGPTFRVLKENGFWATANFSSVPLGETAPADPVFALRSANTVWSDFPALRRLYPHNYNDENIAVDLFLGNPVLFMGHQDTFFDGIGSFSPSAARVNARQPSVRWAGLGEISRLLHLQRWPDDRHCQIRLVAHHARIANPHAHPVEFSCTKAEPHSDNVVRVLADGSELPWSAVDGELRFQLTLPAQAAALVEIQYQFATAKQPVEVRRRGFKLRVLRLISDFRDLVLPRTALGRRFTRGYYQGGKKRTSSSSRLPQGGRK